MNNIKKMIKETYEFSKKLTSENDKIFTDIVCYLRASSMSEQDAEESIQEILDMFLRAQDEGKNINEVIGEDYKAFCDSIIRSSGKESFFKSIIEKFNILVVGAAILIGINFAVDTIFKFIKGSKVNLDYSLTLGGAVNIAIIILTVFLVFKYIGKNSFNTKDIKKSRFYDFLFGVAYVSLIMALVFIEWFLANYVLFTTKIYYLALVLGALYYLTSVLKRNLFGATGGNEENL